LIAPDLFLAELGSALTRKVRRREIGVGQAWQALAEGRERVQLFASTDLASPVFHLSLSLHHAIYDCYYLALAEALNTPMVTSDRTLVLKVRGTGLGSRIHLLGEEIPQ
jgi:predicted nucleic acid-binding protein